MHRTGAWSAAAERGKALPGFRTGIYNTEPALYSQELDSEPGFTSENRDLHRRTGIYNGKPGPIAPNRAENLL